MITVNSQQYDFCENMTITRLIDFLQNQHGMSTSALLVTVNDKIISPAVIDKVFINDGDILKIRILPIGG